MSEKQRIALVGCGTISANHMQALANCDTVEVCALCDVRIERAQALRDRYAPRARIYTDYDRMLTQEALYAVHICTPHNLHTPMACAALARDLHVFLEKPMAISPEQLDTLLQAEQHSRGRICVCFQNRFSPAFARARALCEADGGVLTASATVIWNRNKPYYTESGWRGKRSTEGGGVMINQAIHTVDLLCQLLGRPTDITATCANHHLKDVNDVEDTCEGLLHFDSGKQAVFYATTASAAPQDVTCLRLTTAHHTIEMRTPYLLIDDSTIEKTEDTRWLVGKACYGSGHGCLIPRFYEALADGTPMPVSLQSARYAHDILFAAYRSNDTRVNL